MGGGFRLAIRGDVSINNISSLPSSSSSRVSKQVQSSPKVSRVKRLLTKKTTLGKKKKTKKEEYYYVQSLCGKRQHNGRTEYYVKWRGYPASDNTWEPISNLAGCENLIDAYNTVTVTTEDSVIEEQSVPISDPDPERETNENEDCSTDEEPQKGELERNDLSLMSGRKVKSIKEVWSCPTTGSRSYHVELGDQEFNDGVPLSGSLDLNASFSEAVVREKWPQLLLDFLLSKIVWTTDANDCKVVVQRLHSGSTENDVSATLDVDSIHGGSKDVRMKLREDLALSDTDDEDEGEYVDKN